MAEEGLSQRKASDDDKMITESTQVALSKSKVRLQNWVGSW